jgi:rhodanese-related sulfurtransferase
MKIITMTEVEEILENSSTLVINVLNPDDFERGRIPETRNIPVDDPRFLDHVQALVPDEDSPIVVYCGGGECESSFRAARELENAGYEDVSTYEGGMKEWIGAGREIETGEYAPAR